MDKLNGKQGKERNHFAALWRAGLTSPKIAFLTASFLQGITARSRTSSHLLVALLEQKEKRERKQPVFCL